MEGRSRTRATPGLLWAAAPLAAETSFERAATLASRLLGFGLNAKWMEREFFKARARPPPMALAA